MVAIVIIAILLGACMTLRSWALSRQRAIEAVDRLHGTYGVKRTGPEWYRRVMGRFGVNEKAFYDPTRVSFGPMNSGYDPRHPLRDADVASLSDQLALFSNLDHLDFRNCRLLTDRGIKSLPYLPRLKRIRLGGTGVTEAGVVELRRRYQGIKVMLDGS